ncbi:MAG: hypothetical protein ACE15B_19120 [Bryobacteraceae bacterium]
MKRLGVIAVLALGAVASACAGHRYGYVSRIPPPPPPPYAAYGRVAPSPGMVWTGGYWAWRGRWVWVPGQYLRPPHRNARWTAGYWAHRHHGWVWVPGYWR